MADLIEAAVGRWEGLTWDEARRQDQAEYDRFRTDPGTVPYPDGESSLDVARRAGPAPARLAAAHPGGSIVVGHNVLNRAALTGPLSLPIERARSIRQSNGGISLLEYGDDPDRPPTGVTLNACLHLEGIETAGAPPTPRDPRASANPGDDGPSSRRCRRPCRVGPG